MSDEERKAVDKIKTLIQYLNVWKENFTIVPEDVKYLVTILNLIEKQSKEIEHQKEKRENQKQELAILNAKQIEFNKLVNTVNSYKGQFKRQQKEIEYLKDINKKLEARKYMLNAITGEVTSIPIDNNYISKDKIKAKIEEVSNGTYDAKIVLQSLLEKE